MQLTFVKRERSAGPRRTSIRAKLTALVAVSVGAAALIGTGVSAYRESNRDAGLQGERLSAAAAVLASSAARATAANDSEGAFEAIRSITLMPEVSYARIERSGHMLAETG